MAVVANQCTVDHEFEHLVDHLANASNVNLVRIFAPEHGFRGVMQDMDHIADARDKVTNVSVVSLYGSSAESLRPAPALLADVDVLLVDLPDIGARYYTFAQTLTYCMQVAAQTGTKVVVLDRPNPIAGDRIEGLGLHNSCQSFCGYASMPQRHGLTLGELAKLVNAGFGAEEESVPPINCDLEIIPCANWSRSMYFDQTGLRWVIPSVNMPTLDTAIVYPGLCLLEATNLSEGRGTTRPFEIIGAPYIDGRAWANETMNVGLTIEGATLRPLEFMPKFQKHANTVCGGVQIHVTDRARFEPFRLGLALIAAAKRLYPDAFAWRPQAYEFVDKVPAIDLLYGTAEFRALVDADAGLSVLEPKLQAAAQAFAGTREPFLLY